jgi:hypothetical protein
MPGATILFGKDAEVSPRAPARHSLMDHVVEMDHAVGFLSALFSGDDSRISPDPDTGLNKYLCPALPVPGHVYVSSCTASPASARGFDCAAEAFADIMLERSQQLRAHRLAALTEDLEIRLLRHFDVTTLARVFLCPSGTDALLTTTRLIAAERSDKAMTTILPSASETGTGVPMAVTGRVFSGSDTGKALIASAGQTVEVSLRSQDGSPRGEDAVNRGFAVAAAAATGRVIVILTHSTKTGLIAPVAPPSNADVIVDACQARIAPATVAAYLGRGWPVVISGSKFYGGPAFSGAVFFPAARLPAHRRPQRPDVADLGTVLRWVAALTEIDAFAAFVSGAAAILADEARSIELGLASNPALVPFGGLPPKGRGWADQPSIFTFGVQDPMDRRRVLSAPELRPIHAHLARSGVLLGQPVDLGSCGGLRIAIGARTLMGRRDSGLARVFAALEAATTFPRGPGGDVV